MKLTRTSLIASCLVFLLACKKDKDSDKRSEFTGDYNNLRDEITYIYDGATYRETDKTDTVSFSIVAIDHPDSSDYIAILGVNLSTKHTDPTFRFEKNGLRIVAQLDEVGFTIPDQQPARPNGMSIGGDGEIKNGKLVLSYHTNFSEYTKHGSIVEH
jgi:hypothetical protein